LKRCQQDPLFFSKHILGCEQPWHKQEEILLSVRDTGGPNYNRLIPTQPHTGATRDSGLLRAANQARRAHAGDCGLVLADGSPLVGWQQVGLMLLLGGWRLAACWPIRKARVVTAGCGITS
jgi:hypothetical protein